MKRKKDEGSVTINELSERILGSKIEQEFSNIEMENFEMNFSIRKVFIDLKEGCFEINWVTKDIQSKKLSFALVIAFTALIISILPFVLG